ncbi:hypothetical protein GCM10012287_51530 [Streptomyces daqingensis]|uniref:Uncharacterized protein n=1 Tax=Streptomyces daqingensis TaxID=1472640 RepID=A0ABQ2MSC1_9ACTN|nr:hypothetical protein GCM10012287_51530 [Streptomyces daqingensis]
MRFRNVRNRQRRPACREPGEDGSARNSGASWLLRGTPGGLGADGALSFDPGDLGAPAAGAELGRWSAN